MSLTSELSIALPVRHMSDFRRSSCPPLLGTCLPAAAYPPGPFGTLYRFAYRRLLRFHVIIGVVVILNTITSGVEVDHTEAEESTLSSLIT